MPKKERFALVSRSAKCQMEFERVFLESIDEGLACLGDIPKQLLYSQLEEEFGLSQREFLSRLEEFSGALEKIFGPGGNFVEIEIMKSLYSKLKCSLEWKQVSNFKFPKYVKLMKFTFLEKDSENASIHLDEDVANERVITEKVASWV